MTTPTARILNVSKLAEQWTAWTFINGGERIDVYDATENLAVEQLKDRLYHLGVVVTGDVKTVVV